MPPTRLQASLAVLFVCSAAQGSPGGSGSGELHPQNRLQEAATEASAGLVTRFADDAQVDLKYLLVDAGAPAVAIKAARSVGLLVLGNGHSGTSTVALWANKFGWKTANPWPGKGEDRQFVKYNNAYSKVTGFNDEKSALSVADVGALAAAQAGNGSALIADSKHTRQWYAKYGRPFLLKDPRLIWSLHLWTPLMERAGDLPLLVCVTRSHEEILASHKRRNEKVTADELTSKIAWREWQLAQWPGPAIVFNIEQLVGAKAANVRSARPGRRVSNATRDRR